MTSRLFALAFVTSLVLGGCSDKTTNDLRPDPTPTPTPVPPPPKTLTVQYRVTGDIPATQITYFSSVQGTTQIKTDLPWVISYQSDDLHPFLYLAAEAPLDNFIDGSLTVQVFVDGVLWREARGSGFVISIAVSGQP
jgi:hypothetical protein